MKTLLQSGRQAARDAAQATASRRGQPGASVTLKRLVWLYFWLLVIEGALRKWLLPQYSAPLLIIRDPVVLLIYFLAAENRLFPKGGFFGALTALAAVSALLMVLQCILLDVPATVLLFGLRTNFLHLPLIFLIPVIFDLDDVRRLGKWVLIASIPMAFLMAYQFRAPADAWINRAPGLSAGSQLMSALGRIRPPGTFSFITGPVSFFALVAVFVLYGLRSGREGYSRPLLLAAGLSASLALAVSGSRAVVISVGIVAVAWLLGILASRQVETGLPRLLILAGITFAILAQVRLFQEGTEVLSMRWEMAASAERAEGGLVGRVLDSLLSPLRILPSIPIFGSGLGVGTNVGATLLTGQAQFLLSEGEWGRVVMEMGPVLGLLFILFRVALVISLARSSLRCATAGHILPLLLFSACASQILNGQIAQPTTLGFTAFGAGLCLAAIRGTALPEPIEKRRRDRAIRAGPRAAALGLPPAIDVANAPRTQT